MTHRVNLLVSSFVFMIGVGSVVGTLPIVLRQLTTNEVEISLAVTVWGLVYLFSNIPAGLLADKVGANKVIPVAFLLNIPIGIIMFLGSTPLDYALARALEGFLEALVWTSVIGLSVKREKNVKIIGVSGVYASIALGFVLGPLLAGSLLAISYRTPFLLYSLCSFISFFVTLPLFRAESIRFSAQRPKLNFGWKVTSPLLSALTVGLVESLIVVYAPDLSSHKIGISSQELLSGYYLFGLLGQISITFLHNVVLTEPYLLAAFLSSSLITLYLPESMILISIGWLGIINAHVSSRSQAKIAEGMQGVESTGAGIANFAWSLGYFLGAPLYSMLNARRLSPQKAIGFIFLVMLLIQLLLAVLEIRRRDSTISK